MFRKCFAFIFFFFICFHVSGKHNCSKQGLQFTENIGQVTDQFHRCRKDIHYVLHSPGMQVFIGNGNLHYQFYKSSILNPVKPGEKDAEIICRQHCEINSYRMDVVLEGGDTGAQFFSNDTQDFYENYFLQSAINGNKAHNYKKVTCKNVYPGIDWELSTESGKLEQNFILHPGADISKIKLQYSGATALRINDNGSITATTPMGEINENAPECFNADGSVYKVIYQLYGNEISLEYPGDHPVSKELVIDPVLEWGTYYGPDTSASPLNSITSDGLGYIYACGFTYAASTGNIATTGSYQITYEGNADAYLLKMDTSGNRIWATYYGGTQLDWGYSVICDLNQNVYMAGFTASDDSLLIATPGSLQPGNGGGMNGFLAKFNADGERKWATFYGGNQQDVIYSVFHDAANYVYIAGVATSSFNIATPGSFEDTFNNPGSQYTAGMLAKFDSNGVRQWGTYYKSFDSGNIIEDVYNVLGCSDGINVYISGWTPGYDSITTPGTWQPVSVSHLGEVFLVKFDGSGNRLWGTFYGGSNENYSGSVICDKADFVYLMGNTKSDSGIASPGSFQPVRAGGFDIFLAKFEPLSGNRVWGTYYGGPGDETINITQIAGDRGNNVFITGYTNSTTGIASAGAWQTVYGGGNNDAFLAEFNIDDSEKWSTYYGGDGDDDAFAAGYDNLNVYICGQSNSTNGIATPGSFDSTYNSGNLYNKGFIGKFSVADSTTFVNSENQFNLLCFPNPTNSILYFSGLSVGDEVTVYNEIGIVVGQFIKKSNSVIGKMQMIDLTHYPDGIYVAEFKNESGVIIKREKVIKM